MGDARDSILMAACPAAFLLVLAGSIVPAAQAQRPATAPPLVPVRLDANGSFRIARLDGMPEATARSSTHSAR